MRRLFVLQAYLALIFPLMSNGNCATVPQYEPPEQLIGGRVIYAQAGAVADVDGDGQADALLIERDDAVSATFLTCLLMKHAPDGIFSQWARTDFSADSIYDISSFSRPGGPQLLVGAADGLWLLDVSADHFQSPSRHRLSDVFLMSSRARVLASQGDSISDVVYNVGPRIYLAHIGTDDQVTTSILATADASISYITTADVNGDGRIDVLACDANSNFLTFHQPAQPGDAWAKTALTMERRAGAAPVAMDWDGDGDIDVIYPGAYKNLNPPGYGLYWIENRGSGSVPQWTSHLLRTSSNLETPLKTDLTGAGRHDILAGGSAGWGVLIHDASTTSGFTYHPLQQTPYALNLLAVPDSNGTDSRFVALNGSQVDLWTVSHEPPFVTTDTPLRLWDGFWSDIRMADLDNDGRQEMILLGTQSSVVMSVEQDPWRPGYVRSRVVAGGETSSLSYFATALADLDGDGDTDVITIAGRNDHNEVVWMENGGQTPPTWTRREIANVATPYASNPISYVPVQVQPADLDRDGDLDLVCSSYFNQVFWLENDGGQFTAHMIFVGSLGRYDDGLNCLRVGDINHDGLPDVVCSTSADDAIVAFLNQPEQPGTFARRDLVLSQTGIFDIQLADLNYDGDLDIVAVDDTNNKISWYRNDGLSLPSFDLQPLPDVGVVHSVQVGDLNGDGHPDLLPETDGTTIPLLINDGACTPTFSLVLANRTTPPKSAVHAIDFNQDGHLDLVARLHQIDYGTGSIDLLVNQHPPILSMKLDRREVRAGDPVAVDWTIDTHVAGDTVRFVLTDLKGNLLRDLGTGRAIGGSGHTELALPLMPGGSYDIRAQSVLLPSVTARGQGPISIDSRIGRVLAPDAGDSWSTASTVMVHWQLAAAAGTAAEIELWRDTDQPSSPTRIAHLATDWAPSGEGATPVVVPGDLRPGGGYFIRLVSSYDHRLFVDGDRFSVNSAPAAEPRLASAALADSLLSDLHYRRYGDVVWFIRDSPRELARYDLATQSWLPTIAIANTVQGFVVEAGYLYLIDGHKLVLCNLDGSNPVTIYTCPDYIYDFKPMGPNFVLSALGNTYIVDRVSGTQISSSRTADVSTNTIVYPDDNTFITLASENYPASHRLREDNFILTEVFATAQATGHIFALPGGERIVFGDGQIFARKSLIPVGNFGVTVDDVTTINGLPVVLSGDRLYFYNAYDQQVETRALDLHATQMAVQGNQLFLFADAGAEGMVVSSIPLATMPLTAPQAPVDLATLQYQPDVIAGNGDGILYLLSTKFHKVFRWSIAKARYLDPIETGTSPEHMIYSPDLNRLYVTYYAPSTSIRMIDLNTSSPTAVDFIDAPAHPTGMAPVGNMLFVKLEIEYATWHSDWIYNADADEVSHSDSIYESSSYVWDPRSRRIYGTWGDQLVAFPLDASGQLAYPLLLQYPSINYYLGDQIRLSPDGTGVLTASGDLFDGVSTTHIARPSPGGFLDAAWWRDNFVTLAKATSSTLTFRDSTNWKVRSQFNLPGTPLRLISDPLGLVVIREIAGKPRITLWQTDVASLAVDPPGGGAPVPSDASISIPWSVQGNVNDQPVRFELYRDGAKVLDLGTDLALTSRTTSTFYLPLVPQGDRYRIRIVAQYDDSVAAFSDEFTIQSTAFDVLSPAAGQHIPLGPNLAVQWRARPVPGFTAPQLARIELWKGSSKFADLGTVQDSGCLNFDNLPIPVLPAGDDYWLRIVSLADENQSGAMTGRFSIVDRPVRLVDPITPRFADAGSFLTVSWHSDLALAGTAVRIVLADSDGFEETLGYGWSPSGEGQTSVLIPLVSPYREYHLRVESTWNPSLSDESASFEVYGGQLHLDNPAPFEVWRSGTLRSVRWHNAPDLSGDQVELELWDMKRHQQVASLGQTTLSGQAGMLSLIVPDLPSSSQYRLLMRNLSSLNVLDGVNYTILDASGTPAEDSSVPPRDWLLYR